MVAHKRNKPENYNKAIAFKAIHFAPGYSSVDRSVAALLIEHHNNESGQCDPSNERVARMLGIDERTVRRATSQLCGEGRLFWKVSHGGKYGRTSYTPQWSVFRTIVEDLEQCIHTGAALAGADQSRTKSPGSEVGNRAKSPGTVDDGNRAISPGTNEQQQGEMVRTTGRNGPAEQGETALQNHLSKPSKETIGTTEPSEFDAARDDEPQNCEQMLHGLWRGNAGGPRARKDRSRGPAAMVGRSKSEAAQQAAYRRLNKAIGCEAREWREEIWLLEPEDMNAAVDAEMDRRDAGIALLRLRMVDARMRYSAGLPAARSGCNGR